MASGEWPKITILKEIQRKLRLARVSGDRRETNRWTKLWNWIDERRDRNLRN